MSVNSRTAKRVAEGPEFIENASEDNVGERSVARRFGGTKVEGGASHFLNTGRGRPVNSQPRTAALRSAGVRACEFWHRPGAMFKNSDAPTPHSKAMKVLTRVAV